MSKIDYAALLIRRLKRAEIAPNIYMLGGNAGFTQNRVVDTVRNR